jgi:hypothetical protein
MNIEKIFETLRLRNNTIYKFILCITGIQLSGMHATLSTKSEKLRQICIRSIKHKQLLTETEAGKRLYGVYEENINLRD